MTRLLDPETGFFWSAETQSFSCERGTKLTRLDFDALKRKYPHCYGIDCPDRHVQLERTELRQAYYLRKTVESLYSHKLMQFILRDHNQLIFETKPVLVSYGDVYSVYAQLDALDITPPREITCLGSACFVTPEDGLKLGLLGVRTYNVHEIRKHLLSLVTVD